MLGGEFHFLHNSQCICTVVKPDQSTSLKNGLMYNQEKTAALVLQVNSHERDGVTS